MSIDEGIDKEYVVHMHNRLLLSHKMEWTNAICGHRWALEIFILSEVSQRKTNIISYHLYVEYKIVVQMNPFT